MHKSGRDQVGTEAMSRVTGRRHKTGLSEKGDYFKQTNEVDRRDNGCDDCSFLISK